MQVRFTTRTTLNCFPICLKQNSPALVFGVSSDKGSLSSVVSWPCGLLLDCQLEGQAEVASWPRSSYSKTVLPLSLDTGVRSKRGLLPVT